MSGKAKKAFGIIAILFILGFVFLISVAYIQYRDLKTAVLAKLSSKTTSFIGQDVSIGDLSLSPTWALNLHTITIHNPEGFGEGNLLTIKKLKLKIRYRELLKKHLYFDEIVVTEPELTVTRNSEGRFNISDSLFRFFQREPALRYHIDEFAVHSGIIDINRDQKFRNDDITIVIKNLSSALNTKTLIRADTTYAGSRIGIEGWIFLKDEPKLLNVALSSEDVSLAPFVKLLREYGMEIAKTKAAFLCNIEGDTARGFNLSAEIGMKDAGFRFLKKDAKEILLTIRAFFDIPAKSLMIDQAYLKAGGVTSMTGKGEIKKAGEDIEYSATVKINMLDLSAINIIKDTKISGFVNAENLRVQGSSKKTVPDVSGDIRLSDAGLQFRNFDLGELDADLQLRSPVEGSLGLQMKKLTCAGYSIPWLQAKTDIAYRDHAVTLRAAAIGSEKFKLSSDQAIITLPKNRERFAIRADIRGLHASYPDQKVGIENAALSITMNKVSNVMMGDAGFSADALMLKGITFSFIKGSGRFDDKKFFVDITQADISGGRLRIAAEGHLTKDTFPVTISTSAEHIHIEALMRDISRFAGAAHPLSGTLKKLVFEGTVNSIKSVHGKASVQAERLIIPYTDKRNIIEDGKVKAEIDFKGKDFDISADMNAGKILLRMSGAVKDFGYQNRAGQVMISVPDVALNDIRDTLWGVFPDGLLYAGMDGSMSSEMTAHFGDSSFKVNGAVVLNGIVLEGENREYKVGPVQGVLPVVYVQKDEQYEPPALPSFKREEFKKLSAQYEREPSDKNYSLITIEKVSYGFPMLEDVKIWIKPVGKFLHIGRFSGNIFEGKLIGAASINLADALAYKAGFLIEGLSLSELCDRIEPIRGYISGKVDGIATLKGEGGNLTQLLGKGEFWTYSTPKEKTKISKEFLQKVGGISLRRYLGDRKFDTGVMNFYLQGGYVVFRELEISNKNFFGMKDLDIKVAPFNNRISLDHLMWSITEAAYRAQKKE